MPLELEVAKGAHYIPLVNCDHRNELAWIPVLFEWSLLCVDLIGRRR